MNAFEIAKSGEKHSGLYYEYLKKTNNEIERAIRSLERRISEHQSWIQNPEQHLPNFRSPDPRQQKALVENKWLSDVARRQQQKTILEGIIQERNCESRTS